MSIIHDYKKFATAENLKHFSFVADTMIQNSEEFKEALLQMGTSGSCHAASLFLLAVSLFKITALPALPSASSFHLDHSRIDTAMIQMVSPSTVKTYVLSLLS